MALLTDALAIAIGTSHGAYKFSGASKLDFERLKKIREAVKVPLVLHGASGIPASLKKLCTKYGCKIADAKGVSDANIKKAFDAGVRQFLHDNPEVFDPRKILGPAKDLMTKVIRQKMRMFGCAGKG